ncbi:hypothetical protein QJS10_CPB11g01382 [Acorus calamus]|uniref:MHD1 domain-containing protein n=1 Tax=Acorus calamus TaxID=4465 RepID=A0AAV9DTR3_ACOCL|nr:hypothetical protein QJS10_CPB11g01382 [Acorus calamus]
MDKSSAIEYINQMFPTEASLSGVEPLIQKIHGEIRRVDAGILSAVRQQVSAALFVFVILFDRYQSNSGTKAKEDLAAATRAVQELTFKIREIKTKAEQSEMMVQEICRDIKKLDFAKKHITTTITALHRLTMLVSAVEQLQVMASKRQYKEAAAQLEAVNQLCSHFEAYRDIPKIIELRDKFKNIKQVLKSHVFSDFSSLGTGKETEESNLLRQLTDACFVVDALEPSVREELVKIFAARSLLRIGKFLKAQTIHQCSLLVDTFVKGILHKTQLVEILDNLKEKPEVGSLLTALQRTLEFEEELAEKFSGGTTGARSKVIENDMEETNEGDSNSQIVSDIRKKYEKKLAAHHASGTEPFNFHGIISSCFEPHLTVYVELEEKSLMENLEKLVQEETWDPEEGSQTNILSSSMQVFLIIRRSLKRCSALTKNQTLFNLFKSGELAENVSKIIDSQFADKVDMSEVEDEFSAVITKALMTLVHGLETKFDAEMVAMTRVPWGTLESVGDQSEYVNGINSILTSSIPVLGGLLSPIYFQFFLDKLAASLGPRFYLNIYKCKQISETGAQQMLLDTQAVKTILLEIPALGRQTTGAASYSKYVSREMSKAEALLKVILSPIDSVGDTYRALLPEGTHSEFQRILELKGLKKVDQQAILDDFNKHSPGITHPSTAPTIIVPSAPAAPTIPTSSTSSSTSNPYTSMGGVLTASREDVLARAAALGRGAATTGFKRFLALTEAAKDRKDGPFRKLFNP